MRVNRLRQSGDEIARASYIYEKELGFLLEVKAEDVEEQTEEPKEAPGKSAPKRKQYRTLRSPAKRQCKELDTVPDPEPEQQQDGGLHTILDTLNCSSSSTTNASTFHNPKSDGNSSSFTPDINAGTAVPAASSTFLANGGSSSDPPDPDQAFFDSIKPDMQRMSSDQKLEFKIEVLKILRNFKWFSNCHKWNSFKVSE